MTQQIAKKKAGKPAPMPAAADPVQVLNYIVTNGGTPDLVKQTMDLANQWQDREAARVFGERFSLFQAELPQIEKTRDVDRKDGTRMYRFAALEDIERVVQPIKAKHGLSTSGTIKTAAAGIEVTWTLQIGSHRETREYVLPQTAATGIIQGGNVTQNLGAWMTYIRRYTYCMALGIVVRDEDTDANAVRDVLAIDAEQRQFIDDCLTSGIVKPDGSKVSLPLKGLLEFVQGTLPEAERSLDRMTQQQFDKFVGAFKLKYLPKGGAK